MKCWILLKNALSQKGRMGAHVVVNGAKFGHGNSSARERKDSSSKVNRKKEDYLTAYARRERPAYFAMGSDNRDDEKTVLNELVPTEACRNSSGAGTSLFWSSVVRYSRIL